MNPRIQALLRLVLIIPAYIVLLILSPVFFVAVVATFLIDIGLQLVTGGRALGSSGNLSARIVNWYISAWKWFVYGG